MATGYKFESFTWGGLILVLGLLLQAHYLRPEWGILPNLYRLWPVLLIVAGLNKVLRFLSSRPSKEVNPPQ